MIEAGDREFLRSVEIKVLIDTLWALYGPKDPDGTRPRRSRSLKISRPQRAIKRGQKGRTCG